MARIGHRQKEILDLIPAHDGATITKTQVVDELDNYFYGGPNHLQAVLARMVKSGLLVRVKRGVYKRGKVAIGS